MKFAHLEPPARILLHDVCWAVAQIAMQKKPTVAENAVDAASFVLWMLDRTNVDSAPWILSSNLNREFWSEINTYLEEAREARCTDSRCTAGKQEE